MNDVEGSFDWVSARYTSCSIENLFDKLRLSVKNDVEIRQGLRKQLQFHGYQYGFSFASNDNQFSVTVRQKRGPVKVATFKLDKNRIVVFDENDKEFLSAKATLDKNRQCRFAVGDEELEDWQFRQKALEAVLFGDFDE
jgi:hypothetical protein